MNRQPHFSRSQLIKIIGFMSGTVAIVVLLGWAARSYTNIKIDWSFLIPLGAVMGGAIPIINGITGWQENKLNAFNERISALEVLSASNKDRLDESSRDRHELRKILLKLEARIESIRDTQTNTTLGQIIELNRQLLERIEGGHK